MVYRCDRTCCGAAKTPTVELADGWYRGSNGGAGQTNTFGTQTKLLAQLELTLGGRNDADRLQRRELGVEQ